MQNCVSIKLSSQPPRCITSAKTLVYRREDCIHVLTGHIKKIQDGRLDAEIVVLDEKLGPSGIKSVALFLDSVLRRSSTSCDSKRSIRISGSGGTWYPGKQNLRASTPLRFSSLTILFLQGFARNTVGTISDSIRKPLSPYR